MKQSSGTRRMGPPGPWSGSRPALRGGGRGIVGAEIQQPTLHLPQLGGELQVPGKQLELMQHTVDPGQPVGQLHQALQPYVRPGVVGQGLGYRVLQLHQGAPQLRQELSGDLQTQRGAVWKSPNSKL